MHEHLIFFDDECPLCHRAVRHILEIDREKHFLFAPLTGKSAQEILIGPQSPLKKANSLVLVEHFRSTNRTFWIRGQAVFRIYWLTGQGWGFLGALSFLPGWLLDSFYKKVAAHRHQFKLQIDGSPVPAGRLLP